MSPGNMKFEDAPFKITNVSINYFYYLLIKEYVDILDGVESSMFLYFKSLILRGLIELKSNYESIVKLIQIMSVSSEIQCFSKPGSESIAKGLEERLLLKKNSDELIIIIDKWIESSVDNWRTTYYDKFQLLTNGIKP